MAGTDRKAPFVLLDRIGGPHNGPHDGLADGSGHNGGAGFPDRLYHSPRDVITCTRQEDIAAAIAAMEAALDAGHHVAGWIGYEAGYALEPKLAPLAPRASETPLVWMGVFDGFDAVDSGLRADLFGAPRHPADEYLMLGDLTPAIGKADYAAALARIHDYLLAGDVYQINYTFPLRFTLTGTPGALYRRLRAAQPVGFGAWIDTGEMTVLSLSPELFMDKQGPAMTARPMKGTAPRGRTLEEDDARARALVADPKSRAENLMILDLLRNDLSRLAEDGSVEVPRLFEVERYRTLLQMTSTVTARVDEHLPVGQLLASLFPCGSVTGAPKIRAMEIIRELEALPRGPYTGAIGCITPDRDFTFSVPIRTMTLTPDEDAPRRYIGSLGIGGGIVADSDTSAEYEECLLKGRFLTAPQPEFDLIETIGWSAGDGYRLLDGHMARLEASARFFGFVFDAEQTRTALAEAAETFQKTGDYRVRLLLAQRGTLSITATPFEAQPADKPLTVTLARAAVDSADPLLYHKTTARKIYDRGLAEARARTSCFEALFVNERNELTEGSFTNLFVEKAGRLLTPPLSSGLLPGVLRADLIASGKAEEAVLTPADLHKADKIYVGNALRGLIEVTLV